MYCAQLLEIYEYTYIQQCRYDEGNILITEEKEALAVFKSECIKSNIHNLAKINTRRKYSHVQLILKYANTIIMLNNIKVLCNKKLKLHHSRKYDSGQQ